MIRKAVTLHTIAVRLTATDLAWLDAQAERDDLTRSDILRRAVETARRDTSVLELFDSLRSDLTAEQRHLLAALIDRLEPIQQASAEMLAILKSAKINDV